ncbi:MAG: hypothetical protein B6244_08660 [Candidatus Cloacimonetes bacterium 4572_55]|nr:MAG: hypothetical protein B6244_08660 [Candidatus Cloacimonetes bacterium 4572_55]
MANIKKFILLTTVIFLFISVTSNGQPIHESQTGMEENENPVRSLIAVGDIMMSGKMESFIIEKGADYPFKYTKEMIRSADVAIGNLEAPLGPASDFKGPADPTKTYTFLASPKCADGIKNAGFDVLCLANNHIMDFGARALTSTVAILDSAGLIASGAGENLEQARQPKIYSIDGYKIAFLSYSATYPKSFYATASRPGTAQARRNYIQKDVSIAAQQADMVVVSFHWGQELLDYPKGYQKDLARLAIDSGALLVIGHHPHILQGVEAYKNGVIAYSLGNFAFGSYSPNAKTSAALKVYFDQNGLKKAELIPLIVDNFKVHFQTKIETGTAAEAILNEIVTLSKPFGTEIDVKNDIGVISINKDK